MNHKAMLELADRLEREMPRVNMKVSIHESDCGTVCCIAGWFCIWNLGPLGEDVIPTEAAQTGLELSNKEANQLFYVSNWPTESRDQYYRFDDLPREFRNPKQCRLMSEHIRRMVREDIAKVSV